METSKDSYQLVKFVVVTAPMIRVEKEIEYGGGKVIFRIQGYNEIWALNDRHAHDLASILVVAVTDREFDLGFAVKLLEKESSDLISLHPADSRWAYSQIPIDRIPVLSLSQSELDELECTLQRFGREAWSEMFGVEPPSSI